MSESKPMNVEFRTKCATTAMKAVHLLASPDYLDNLEKGGSIKGSPLEQMIDAGQTFQVDVKNDKSPVEISTEGKANVWLRKSQSAKRVLCISDPDTGLYAEISEGTNNVRVFSRTTTKEIKVSVLPSNALPGTYTIGDIEGKEIGQPES